MPTIVKQVARPALKQTNSRPQGGRGLDALASGWPEETGINLLLYGRSGTGKTTLWATFPGPILVAICSGGTNPGELRSVDTTELRKKIRPVRLTSSADMGAVIEEAKAGGCATLVLDHVSGLQDLTLKEILGLDELPAQKGWGMATMQNYGQSSLQTKEILRAMLGLPCNVVIIGQERASNDEGTSEIIMPTVGVATTPSVANWLYPAVDYICQTFVRPKTERTVTKIGGKETTVERRSKGVEYVLRTAPHDVYTTKFRMPRGTTVLPEVIVDPSYEKIAKLIKG